MLTRTLIAVDICDLGKALLDFMSLQQKNDCLLFAAESNNLPLLRLLLNTGVDINYAPENGDTVIKISIRKGYREMAEFLFHRQATIDINAEKELYLRTGLEACATWGWTNLARLIISRSLLFSSKYLIRPLGLAVKNGHTDLAILFLGHSAFGHLENRALEGLTPLAWAASNGREKMINALLQTNCRFTIHITGSKGRTALHLAAKNGHARAVTILLNNGAKTSTLDDYGLSAWALAAAHDHSNVMRLLSTHVEKETPLSFNLGGLKQELANDPVLTSPAKI
jgi:ankyrin repeat protein